MNQIRLNKESINHIIKDSNEVVVFGLRDCHYLYVIDALEHLKIKAYSSAETNFPIIPYDEARGYGLTRWCKSILTSLIIENYKRIKQNKPLIPLIFCVGLEEASQTVSLDIKKVAQSRSRFGNNNITDKELRRCFKITEMSPELKKIVEETVKFVKLRQDPDDKFLYTLKQVKPFWEESEWEPKLWQARKNKNFSKTKPAKQFLWREILTDSIKNSNHNHSKKLISKL